MVAQRAGVSPSTVSRALRDHPRLSAETKVRVRAAAAALGYNANPVIADIMRRVRSGGARRQLGTIAYLTFHSSPDEWKRNATYSNFYAGALKRASDLGFSLELVWAKEPDLTSDRLTDILVARGVVGVIVGPRPVQPKPDILDWSPFAVACLGVPVPGLGLHQSGCHHGRMLERMLAALDERGYRRAALVLVGAQLAKSDQGWPSTWSYAQEQIPPSRRIPLYHPEKLEPAAFAQWLRRARPDVIIGMREVALLLFKLGIRVPQDVAYACLSCRSNSTEFAGVDQQPQTIGAGAVDLVANQILSGEKGIPPIPHYLLTSGVWVDGDTARTAKK